MMIEAASASLNVMSGDGAMIRDNKKITTTNTAAAMYALRIDGNANRSRVRNATAPRSRSCGSTSSTMNSRIIGTARRKLPPQSQFFGNSPVGRSNAMRVAKPEHDRADERQRQVAQPPEHGRRERVDDEQRQQRRAERSALERRDEDAGERRQRHAEHPAARARPDRVARR